MSPTMTSGPVVPWQGVCARAAGVPIATMAARARNPNERSIAFILTMLRSISGRFFGGVSERRTYSKPPGIDQRSCLLRPDRGFRRGCPLSALVIIFFRLCGGAWQHEDQHRQPSSHRLPAQLCVPEEPALAAALDRHRRRLAREARRLRDPVPRRARHGL